MRLLARSKVAGSVDISGKTSLPPEFSIAPLNVDVQAIV